MERAGNLGRRCEKSVKNPGKRLEFLQIAVLFRNIWYPPGCYRGLKIPSWNLFEGAKCKG
jgi:hypothetical protein